MTYRLNVQRSISQVLRRAGTTMALTSTIIHWFVIPQSILAADKLIGIQSARVLSQPMPWVTTEAGLFKKYKHRFVFRLIPTLSREGEDRI